MRISRALGMIAVAIAVGMLASNTSMAQSGSRNAIPSLGSGTRTTPIPPNQTMPATVVSPSVQSFSPSSNIQSFPVQGSQPYYVAPATTTYLPPANMAPTVTYPSSSSTIVNPTYTQRWYGNRGFGPSTYANGWGFRTNRPSLLYGRRFGYSPGCSGF